jgi:hypothetical protein
LNRTAARGGLARLSNGTAHFSASRRGLRPGRLLVRDGRVGEVAHRARPRVAELGVNRHVRERETQPLARRRPPASVPAQVLGCAQAPLRKPDEQHQQYRPSDDEDGPNWDARPRGQNDNQRTKANDDEQIDRATAPRPSPSSRPVHSHQLPGPKRRLTLPAAALPQAFPLPLSGVAPISDLRAPRSPRRGPSLSPHQAAIRRSGGV